MIMLGIDPGLLYSGFSVLKQEKGTLFLVDFGYLAMKSSQSLTERVGIFSRFYEQKIITHSVTHVTLETPFLGRNAQNFLKLGYLRGIVYFLVDKHKITLYEFSPREIKQAITGYGGASKDQVARVVLQLFAGMKKPEKEDVTDALAISLCGLWRPKIEKS